VEIRICIDVDDLERAIAFYALGLGLQVGRRFGDGFVEMLGAGSPIDLLLNPPGSAGTAPIAGYKAVRDYARHWTPVHLDFVVDDVDAGVRRLLALGATLESPAADRAWGRIAGMADPFGHGIDLLQFNARGYDALLPA
jgi:catechol 2,3-dioxygenase-like lactoylglutathione lyase family enzyme